MHVPKLPATLQALHPVHDAVEQQTPLTQLFDAHCAPAVHTVPSGRSTQEPVASHTLELLQLPSLGKFEVKQTSLTDVTVESAANGTQTPVFLQLLLPHDAAASMIGG